MIVLVVLGIGNGATGVLFWSMLPDTIEYGEWKTGVRTESSLYGFMTFAQKGGIAISALILGMLLTNIGFVPNTIQSEETLENLKAAFAGESQANRRYLYFAQKADVEGHNDVSALFRSTAEEETGHAHGHLEYFEEVGDPATGLPIGDTESNLKAAVAGETHEYTDMYPGMAKDARDEGFEEIADWMETLAKAERSHANRFQKALDSLED